jgi:hypothetical protein
MPKMFCPQCGRELELDAAAIRFCRYCGFPLADTKDSLQGYSKHKRTGFAVVTWSYALLALVALSLHEKYLPINTGWGYWLSALLIVVSVSLFVSAAVSTLKPQLFAKPKGAQPRDSDRVPLNHVDHATALPAHQTSEEITTAPVDAKELVPRNLSVTEGTTRNLKEH